MFGLEERPIASDGSPSKRIGGWAGRDVERRRHRLARGGELEAVRQRAGLRRLVLQKGSHRARRGDDDVPVVREVEVEVESLAVVDGLAGVEGLLGIGQVRLHDVASIERGGEASTTYGSGRFWSSRRRNPVARSNVETFGTNCASSTATRLRPGLLERLAEAGEQVVFPEVRSADVNEPDRIGRHEREIGICGWMPPRLRRDERPG